MSYCDNKGAEYVSLVFLLFISALLLFLGLRLPERVRLVVLSRGPVFDARAKLARKGVDLLVLNDVSGGAVFGQPHNAVQLLTPDGTVVGPITGSKAAVAHAVWDRVVGLRRSST